MFLRGFPAHRVAAVAVTGAGRAVFMAGSPAMAPRRGYAAGAAAAGLSKAAKAALAGMVSVGAAALAYSQYDKSSSSVIGAPGKPLTAMTTTERYVHDTLTEHARVYTANAPGSDGSNAAADVHTTWVASNDPVEDRHVIATLPGNRLFVGVYDGHAGWQCAELLKRCFHNYVARNLLAGDPAKPLDALTAAYDEMDADLISLPHHIKRLRNSAAELPIETAQSTLLASMSGAVVATALVDDSNVHVAHAGDCRAVIGRLRNSDDSKRSPPRFEAIELTKDHGVENPSEVERMHREHPGEEETVLVRGRVLGGLMPTRSFGDAKYKWPVELGAWVTDLFANSGYRYLRLPRNFKTPPYVTAHPEVVTHAIDDNDCFMVMATDGLWEQLSSQDVVDAVGAYLSSAGSAARALMFSRATTGSTDSSRWAHEDANAAAHVVRNAFGKHSDAVATLLRIPAPHSRRHRDDITVTVVFFKTPAVEAVGAKRPNFKVQADPVKTDLKESKIAVDRDQAIILTTGVPSAKL